VEAELLFSGFRIMAIRIMHVVDHLGRGGLENGLVNLIHHLHPGRFEHVVYAIRSLGPNASRLPRERVEVICQEKRETDSRFQVPALARRIREIRPDIVHSRNWGTIEAVLAGRWTRGCAVLHGEHGFPADASLKEPWRRTCLRRLAFELADGVVTVSSQLRDFHAGRTGFDPDRITVIPNGVDSRRFRPDPVLRERMRRELGLSQDELYIGCVGNLLPVKDHMSVLKAVQTLEGRWRLVIVGEGSERRALEDYIAGHPACKDRITLMGTSGRVPELLNAMDVYVLSSLAEGMSNSLLEAMASGLPAIVTDTGGNPELVRDGETALMFAPRDVEQLGAHLRLLQSRPDLRRQLAERALERAREAFSMDAMAARYEQLYEGLGRRMAAAPVSVAAGI
jgi:sugar transferase (PEP-CTERM/EpsH1 system associated)